MRYGTLETRERETIHDMAMGDPSITLLPDPVQKAASRMWILLPGIIMIAAASAWIFHSL